MKRILAVITLILFLLSSCGQRREIKIDDKFEPLYTPPPLSQTVNRDYYLDATPSMKGYVSSSNNDKKTIDLTRYVRSLKLISEAGFSLSPTGHEHFWRVDVPLVEIGKQEFEVEARKPSFYSLDFYKQTGRLENEDIAKKLADNPNYGIAYLNQVFENINDQNLSVIITDLYEEASNANLLTELIYKKAFSKELTMALICIDSEFNGKVYDVGEAGDAFLYGTSGQVQYHPLFILVIGKPADVLQYSNNLQAGLKTEDIKYNAEVFSDSCLVHPVSIQNSTSIKCEKGDINYKQPGIKLSEQMKNNALALSLKRVKKGTRELELVLKGEPNIICGKNLLECISGKALNTTITFEKYNENDSAGNTYSILANPEKYLNVLNSGSITPDGQYSFKLQFKNAMPNIGLIRMHVTSYIDNEVSVPQWISDRDMPVNEILEWRDNPKLFRGDTTLYLERTFTTLAATFYRDKKSQICDFYLYINIER